MTHCYGYRRKTRKKFQRPYKTNGQLKLSKFMTVYKRGDYVDIITDGSQQKGMVFKDYHGRTAQVYNVNKRSVGVIIKKEVNGRLIEKRINVRIDHVRQSQARVAFKKLVQVNDKKKQEANKAGKRISTKRQPEQPKEIQVIKGEVQFYHPRVFREDF